MTDIFSKDKRSLIMSKISGKDTQLEVSLRKKLFAAGLRYRIHLKQLPGKPDIVLPKYKTIIFVNGCFWHGHKDCKAAKLPETRKEFWKIKIGDNISRDKKNIATLRRNGWKVLVVWQCEINNQDKFARRVATLIDEIRNDEA